MEPTRIRQRKSFAVALLFLLAVALNWPLVSGGFYADDFFFLNLLKNDPDSFSRWGGIWSTEEFSSFDYVWWKDAGWEGRFWRPLPSLAIEGSLRLFGENPLPLHLLAVLLHAGVAVLLYLFARSLGAGRAVSFLAGLFFVTCDDLVFPLCWIATITDVIGVFFFMLALIWHVRWLTSRNIFVLAGSIFALIMALASKESAVAAPPALMLLSFLMPDGAVDHRIERKELRDRFSTWFRRPMSWMPALAVFIIYLVLYKGVPLGTMNNLLYADPVADPAGYLSLAILNLPAYWLGTFSVIPLFVLWYWPGLLTLFAIAGAVVFALLLTALRPFKNHPVVIWSLIVFILALLPQASTLANERGMYFPMIPAALLLGYVAASVKPIAKRVKESLPDTTRWTRFVGWVAVFGLLLPGSVFSAIRPTMMASAMGQMEREFSTACPHVDASGASTIIFLNASEFMAGLYAWDMVNYLCGKTDNVWMLCPAIGVVSLERTGGSSFLIRTDRPGWLSNPGAKIFRVDPVLETGRRYTRKDFAVIVTEVTEDGADILAARFEMHRTLDDPGILFLRWNGRRFEPIDLSALEIGQALVLADTSDIMEW